MRLFEVLSSFFLIAAIGALVIAPSIRRSRLLPAACFLTLLALIVHLVYEGPHWQLIPLYVAGLFLVLFASVGRSWPRWASVVGASVCLLLVLSAGVLSWLMPMFRLPRPTGQYTVGTRIMHLVDTARKEENGVSPSGKRELMVQTWYPAQPASSSHRAMYQRRQEVTQRASYRSVLKTHSWLDAPLCTGGPYPILIYNPSWMGERTEGTFQMEELASHGFIVVGVDHTFFGGLVEFPDGRVDDSRNAPTLGNFEHSSVDEQAALGARYVRIEADDDVFVLDQLLAMNQDPTSPWFHQIDPSRIGALGFSIGGAAAVQMTWQDPRVKAVLDMDGWLFGDVSQHPLARPFMVMYEDKHGVLPAIPVPGSANFHEAQLERQFSVQDFEHVTSRMREHGGFLLFLAGTHHVDFTDRSLFSPIHSWTGRGMLAPTMAHEIVNAYTLAFFSHYLQGTREPLLGTIPAPFKEVEFQHFPGDSTDSAVQAPH